jgi:hypothetical protein
LANVVFPLQTDPVTIITLTIKKVKARMV